MPTRPPVACLYPGCHQSAFEGSYCETHRVVKRERVARGRLKNYPGARERGYTRRWELAAKSYLVRHVWCVSCEGRGKWTPAQCVDHIIPHRGDKNLFWDRENWQALCKSCHGRKTVREMVERRGRGV